MGRGLIGIAALALTACGGSHATLHEARADSPGGPAAPSRLEVLRSGASDAGFARALAVRRFAFPRDHGPHPAYRHEWWYFTGHLKAADGERFGFEVTFFRVALAPPRRAATRDAAVGETSSVGESSSAGNDSSHWRARQIYVAHFAVTDIDRRVFHSTQRFARDALGLAGARADPFRVWVDGWSVAEEGNAGGWTLHAADGAYGLTLHLRPLTAPVLNGDRGLSVKSEVPGAASYYYSIPRLEAHGQLARGGEGAGGSRAADVTQPDSGAPAMDGKQTASGHRALDVSGIVWLDREWGSGSLGPHQQGWDWFALQFRDGSALMFYALRDDGGARDPHSAGTWIAADGSARALASDDVRIDVLKSWTSPGGVRYPSQWRIRVGSLGLDVEASPVLADQELDTTPRYWEGDVDVSGTRGGRPLSGQGYVELVGYAGG